MISDLDIWRAANLLIRQHGGDAELTAAQRADLMHAALWAAVWTFGPSSNAAISTGKPSGSGSGGQSSSFRLPRPGRHIEPQKDGDGHSDQRGEHGRLVTVMGGCYSIRPSTLCASSGFMSRICSSL